MKKQNTETQYDQIYRYVKQHGSITQMQAFRDLGITKLATRISEMTSDGSYTVKKNPVVVTRKDGTRVRYMEYSKIVKKRRPTA